MGIKLLIYSKRDIIFAIIIYIRFNFVIFIRNLLEMDYKWVKLVTILKYLCILKIGVI